MRALRLSALFAFAAAAIGALSFQAASALWTTGPVSIGASVSTGAWETSTPGDPTPGDPSPEVPTPFVPEIPPECIAAGLTHFDSEDIIIGTEGNDVLNAGNGSQLIFGLGGDDIIDGGNGDDCIVGGDGNDTLYGGNGKDVLLGGPGDDQLYAGNGNDYLDGGEGQDICDGGSGNNTLRNCEPPALSPWSRVNP